MPSQFASRLNVLFDQWEQHHGEPLTNQHLADELERRGHAVSKPYLSQLRRGRRTHPSSALIAALADFFAVDPGHFDREPAREGPGNAVLAAKFSDPGIRRLLLRAAGLSEESLDYLSVIAAKLRSADDLPPGRQTAIP